MTNKLLQQLAVCLYSEKLRGRTRKDDSLNNFSNSNMPKSFGNESAAELVAYELKLSTSWVESFNLTFSTDGINWSSETIYNNNMIQSENEVFEIELPSFFPMKFVRLNMLNFTNSAEPMIPAFQFSIFGDSGDGKASTLSFANLKSRHHVDSMIKSVAQVTNETLSIISQLLDLEQQEKLRKQDEVKRVRLYRLFF